MSTSRKNGTEIGPQIRFVEVDTLGIMPRSQPQSWVRALGVSEPAKPVKKKWVYAFRAEADGHCHFAAEVETAEDGTKLRYLLDPERAKKKPLEALSFSPWGEGLTLPTTVQGQPVSYFFVTARMRLGPKALRALSAFSVSHGVFGSLATDGHVCFPLLDLSRRDAVVAANGGKPLNVPVIDPLLIGENLNLLYVKALDHYKAYAHPYTERGQADLEVIGRLLRHQLGELVRDLVRKNPELSNKLADNGKKLYAAVDEVDKEIAKRKVAREKAAGTLCAFLHSPYLPMVLRWHQEAGEADIAEFVTSIALMEHELENSARGAQFLMMPGAATEEVLKSYVFPTLDPAIDLKKRVSISKKCAAPVATYFSKYLPKYLKDVFETAHGSKMKALINESLRGTVDFVNQVLGANVFYLVPAEQGEIRKVLRALEHRRPSVSFSPQQAQEVAELMEALGQQRLKANMAKAKEVFEAKWIKGLGSHVDVVYRALDGINNIWKIVAFLTMDMSKDKTKTLIALSDAFGGTASLLKSFWVEIAQAQAKQMKAMLTAAKLEETSELLIKSVRAEAVALRCLKLCAWVGVVADAASAIKDWNAAEESGDQASKWATGVGGGAAILYGIIGGFGWAVAPAFLIGLLAVQGAAFAAAAWLKDSDLENLVEHCSFGSEHLKENGSIAGIKIGYLEWTDDAEGAFKQIKVLSALLSKFRIQACNEAGVTITLGHVDHGVTANVVYLDNQMDEPCRIEVDLDSGKVIPHGKVPPKLSWKISPPPGTGHFPRTLKFDFRNGQERLDTKSSACRIYLSHEFPFAPAGNKENPLRYLVPSSPVGLNDDEERKHGPFPTALLETDQLGEHGAPGVRFVIRGGEAGSNGEIKASAGS